MKRTISIALAAAGAAALFGGLVYAVLVAAHVSEPASVTVQGLTPRRLWLLRRLCWDCLAWLRVAGCCPFCHSLQFDHRAP